MYWRMVNSGGHGRCKCHEADTVSQAILHLLKDIFEKFPNAVDQKFSVIRFRIKAPWGLFNDFVDRSHLLLRNFH